MRKHSRTQGRANKCVMAMLVLLQFLGIILLLYCNRALYWRSLLLEAQLHVIKKRFARRSRFFENFRRLWVWACRLYGDWQTVCILPKPATVLDWERRRFKDYWTFITNSPTRPGRPEIPQWVKDEIIKYADENPRWGPAQIRRRLFQDHDFRVHIDTVRKHMPKREPDPLSTLRWKQFIRLHMPDTIAVDFFLIRRGVKRPLLVLVMLHHESRRILHVNLCESPTIEWMKQQFLLAFSDAPRVSRILCDNDPLFKGLHAYAKDMFDSKIVHTEVRSPFQNPFVERVIRTIREELTDFMLPVSKTILLQRLLEYKDYYNNHRTHTSLQLNTPENTRNSRPGPDYRLISKPVLGGLHHTYHWKKCA